MSKSINETALLIINLFNHNISEDDHMKINNILSDVRSSEKVDNLALGVANTLETRMIKYDIPFCSENQALALAYVIGEADEGDKLSGNNDPSCLMGWI